MKKMIFSIATFFLCMFGFLMFVHAEDFAYQVSVLSTDGSSQSLGSFASYNEAMYKMKAHSSSSSEVAVIYKNGKIVNANYAIARLTAGYTISLYPTASSSSRYTSVHTSYGSDAAFLDYDDASGRVRIKISGYSGWTSIDYVTVVPLTDLVSNNVKVLADISLRVRTSPSLSGEQIGTVSKGQVYRFYEKVSADGYTWYRVKYNGVDGWFASTTGWTSEEIGNGLQTYYNPYRPSGNLIHYFAYSSGQAYTNLGPNPSYLEFGVSYYSFDGNYFYKDLVTMLNDYKTDTFEHALNKDQPFFAYYLYLSNRSKTNYEAEDFDNIMTNTYQYWRGPEAGVTYVDGNGNWISGLDRSGMSVMYGQGSAFIEMQDTYGVSALLAFSAALNESAKGTSALAFAKNNIFGQGAYDSCPFSCALSFGTVRDSIMYHARLTGSNYNNPTHSYYYGAHYGNKASGMNVLYATDPYWGEKMAANYYLTDLKFGKQDYLATTIGVKQSSEDVPIYAEANTSSKILYYLKNPNKSVSNIPLTVIGKETVNGISFYKVQTDIGVDTNKNLVSDSYNALTSFGYVEASKLYVQNNQPVLTVSDITVEVGNTPNYFATVSATDAEDGNLTSNVVLAENQVQLNVPGIYPITYFVEDSSHFGVYANANVTVKGSTDPVILVSDQVVSQYTSFDAKSIVQAKDYDGTDLTDQVMITGNVLTEVLGTYEVTYTVTNSASKTVSVTISVIVKENSKPEIQAFDRTISIQSSFDAMASVSASDAEDGDLTSSIKVTENTVDVTNPGTYRVTYEVTDSAFQTTIKTVQVIVSDREEKSGEYSFESLTVENGKLILKGFQTIEGISNRLDTDIRYKVIFKNEQTLDLIEQEIPRITDDHDIPFVTEEQYHYSWFQGELDILSLPNGNYSLSIMAYSPTAFSKSTLSNVFGAPMASTYEIGNKTLLIRNNYESREAPIQFFVRQKALGEKTSNSRYNIENEYYTITYENSLLNIRGVSHIIGGDYSRNANVSRTIIFENSSTYETYSYDVGSITDGNYAVELRVSDGFDKTRAWYDAKLDVSTLPKGVYAIYVSTSSNLKDYGELRDIFALPISTTWKQNDKTYSFRVVKEKRYRVELIVE